MQQPAYVHAATVTAAAPHNQHHHGVPDEVKAALPRAESQPRVSVDREPLPVVTNPAAAANMVPARRAAVSEIAQAPKPVNVAKLAAVRSSTSAAGPGSALTYPPTAQPQSRQVALHPPAAAAAADEPEPSAEPLVAAIVAHAPGPAAGSSSKRTTVGTNAAPARRGQGSTCVTRGELCAKAALEQMFPGKIFEKVRPNWLMNDSGSNRPLEIDLYNHELSLAIEHSGQSHYVFPNSLHKTREDFDAQVRRDKLKRTLCARNGVLLIEIPFTVPHGSMIQYIKSEIDRLSDENEEQ